MSNLDSKIKRLADALGKEVRAQSDEEFEHFKKDHETETARKITAAQLEAKNNRIAAINGKSDLNPNWVFENLRVDTPDIREAKSICDSFMHAYDDPDWLEHEAAMLVFWGDYGRGKSHLAGAIAHQLIANHETTVLYRQLSSLLEQRAHSYMNVKNERPEERFNVVYRDLVNADLLIIDEVCVNEESLNFGQRQWLSKLLRERYRKRKKMILITNHNPENLRKALGEGCYGSLIKFTTNWLRFSGESRRRI